MATTETWFDDKQVYLSKWDSWSQPDVRKQKPPSVPYLEAVARVVFLRRHAPVEVIQRSVCGAVGWWWTGNGYADDGNETVG